MEAASAIAAIIALLCEPTSKSLCHEGRCRTVPISAWVEVDPIAGTYARCDRNGCETYSAVFEQSGEFLTAEVIGRGVFARIGSTRRFVETATSGLDVHVSYGRCRPKP